MSDGELTPEDKALTEHLEARAARVAEVEANKARNNKLTGPAKQRVKRNRARSKARAKARRK